MRQLLLLLLHTCIIYPRGEAVEIILPLSLLLVVLFLTLGVLNTVIKCRTKVSKPPCLTSTRTDTTFYYIITCYGTLNPNIK